MFEKQVGFRQHQLVLRKELISNIQQLIKEGYTYSEIGRRLGKDRRSIKKYAKGLLKDLDAVEYSVSSNLSNGFVEGTNNKLK